MNQHKRLEQASLIGLILTFIILISLSIRNYYTLKSFDGYFSLEGGLWPATQLEREFILYHKTLQQIALGEEVSESAYTLRRDIAFSRVAVMRQSIDQYTNVIDDVKASEYQDMLESQLAELQQNITSEKPSSEEAQANLSRINTMVETSTQIVNSRREADQALARERRAILNNLEILLASISFILIAVLPLVVWLSRRRLNTNLQKAYTDLQARSSDLETSQQQLARSNQSMHEQNEQLQETLDKLNLALAERSRLEATVQRIRFPIIPVLQGVVVLPLVGRLNQERMSVAVERTLEHLEQNQVRTLLIDITGTSSLDAATTQQFQTLVMASRLLGVKTILVGVSPAMAEELVQADFHHQDLQVFSTLQQAVKHVLRATPNLR